MVDAEGPRGRGGGWATQLVALTVLMWNVRGLNGARKQGLVDRVIGEQRPDVVMLNETKLKARLYLDGYHGHQTLLKRSGGCATFANLRNHRRVKALGTYLNWTKALAGREELHLVNVYIEPGNQSHIVQRADTVVSLVRDILRQDPAAKVIVGGDLNGQRLRVHRSLTELGFLPALEEGAPTHTEGNHLD